MVGQEASGLDHEKSLEEKLQDHVAERRPQFEARANHEPPDLESHHRRMHRKLLDVAECY